MLAALGFAVPATAQNLSPRIADANICDAATERASRETGVPLHILKAIARTESGLTVKNEFVPWPWTINVEGQGERFENKSQALAHFDKHYNAGSRNIDLGCFQVNHRWHAQRFSSAREMLDPVTNARYAADFLNTLYTEFGDWISAVGAYHSRNQEFAETYLARYTPILEQLTKGQSGADNARIASHPNDFPLLRGQSDGGARGSLFPTNARPQRGLFSDLGTKG